MYIGESKEFINDYLGLGKVSERRRNKKKEKDYLAKIVEENEDFSETIYSISKSNIDDIFYDSQDSAAGKKIKAQPICKYFFNLLEKLKKHPDVYNYFVNEAITMKILQNYMKLKGKSLYNTILHKPSVKRYSVTPTILRETTQEDESYVPDIIEPLNFSRKGYIKHNSYMKSRNMNVSNLKDSDESSSQNSSLASRGNSRSRFLSFKNKKIGLHASNLKLGEIFEEITNNKPKMQSEDFKGYLTKRYHPSIVDTIFANFNFRLGSFDDYINEFNKLINSSEVKHLEFCFSIFDFNKDKKICFKDAFTALEVRTGNYYDNDLRLIVETFDLKKEGKLDRKLRRKSTLSLINERIKMKKKNIFLFLKKDMNDKEKNIFITFKEFCLIKFIGRPQIFLDFLEYTTGYNFLKEKGLLKQISVIASRDSEYTIEQMKSNKDFFKIVSRKEKFDYYIKLESAFSLFTNSQKENLLKKFKYLQFEEKQKLKVITKNSMIEKLPDLLGFNNPYFSERVYEYFSNGRDLTKPIFFQKVYELTIERKEEIASKLAFDLYDSRKDDFLTVDEVYHMFEALPISSQAYSECFKLISLFVLSIFERLRHKLEGITFNKFLELIPVSVIGLDLLEFFNLPFDECLGRKSGVFKTSLLDDNTITMHYSTRSSLLKILD